MAGGWLSGRLGPFGCRVGSVVPQGFAAYARMLHPPQHPRATWAGMCTLNDRTPHALMQWSKICAAVQPDNEAATRHEDRPGPPLEGNLEPLVLRRLLRVLAAFTPAYAQVWQALWEGWGWLHDGASVLLTSSQGDNQPGQRRPAGLPPT